MLFWEHRDCLFNLNFLYLLFGLDDGFFWLKIIFVRVVDRRWNFIINMVRKWMMKHMMRFHKKFISMIIRVIIAFVGRLMRGMVRVVISWLILVCIVGFKGFRLFYIGFLLDLFPIVYEILVIIKAFLKINNSFLMLRVGFPILIQLGVINHWQRFRFFLIFSAN